MFGQANGDKASINATHDFVLRQTQVQRAKCDIFANCRTKQLIIGILEEEPDRSSNFSESRFGHGDRLNDDLRVGLLQDRGGRQQTIQMHQQCRFARSAGTDERDPFAREDRAVHIFQCDSTTRVPK